MATNGINSFVIFLYADGEIQWTTGSASGGTNGLGGTPAQVGFNAGDGIRFASVPGSQTAAIINITTTSNVGIPGVWIYQVDEESIAMGGCSSETNGNTNICDCNNTDFHGNTNIYNNRFSCVVCMHEIHQLVYT